MEPEEFGMKPAALNDISGGDAAENADIIRAVLDGERSPRRDVVLLNTAAALVAAGRAEHIAQAITLGTSQISRMLTLRIRPYLASRSRFALSLAASASYTSPGPGPR